MPFVPARHWGSTPDERREVLACDALVPGGEVLTRAVTVAAPADRPLDRLAAAVIVAGDLVMARRQLLNLKGLAERDARR